jgi:hypothetical protein
MDNAPDYGSGDCRFESCRAHVKIRIGWYAFTDTVMLSDEETDEELCEIPRATWETLVHDIREGSIDEPWNQQASRESS